MTQRFKDASKLRYQRSLDVFLISLQSFEAKAQREDGSQGSRLEYKLNEGAPKN
jgi:hypothetical protein